MTDIDVKALSEALQKISSAKGQKPEMAAMSGETAKEFGYKGAVCPNCVYMFSTKHPPELYIECEAHGPRKK